MIGKLLKNKKAEGYIDIIIGVFIVVIVLVITLNIFTFVTMKTHMDRIADVLIETATYSGEFGEQFYKRVEELQEKYFDFEVELKADTWYNMQYQQVQLGDRMSITIRTHSTVSGVNVVIPMNLSVSRSGTSEQYWRLDEPGYDDPNYETSDIMRYVLDNQAMVFHKMTCDALTGIPKGSLTYTSMPSSDCMMFGYSACTTCNPHVCEPQDGIEYFDQVYHWGICHCGEKAGIDEHFWVYQESDSTYYCSGCLAAKRNDRIYCRECAQVVANSSHSNKCTDHINNIVLQPGLYQAGAIAKYNTGEDVSDMLIKSWDELLEDPGYGATFVVTDGVLTSGVSPDDGYPNVLSIGGDLVIDNSVTTISASLFSSYDWGPNTSLKNVYLPNSITTICDSAFYETGIQTVNLPNSITNYGSNVFYWSNITSIKVPAALSNAENLTFAYCMSLADADLSDCKTMTHLPNSFFYECGSLSNIALPPNLTSIGDLAFDHCAFESISFIPKSVESFGLGAFSCCFNLTNADLSEYRLTTLPAHLFTQCDALTTVTIPSSVTSIGQACFWYCTDLTTINFDGSTEQWNSISKYSDGDKNNDWNAGCGTITVICTDGTITIPANN